MDNLFKLEEKLAFLNEDHEDLYTKLRETVKVHSVCGKPYSLSLDFTLSTYAHFLAVGLWHAFSHTSKTTLVWSGTDKGRVETHIDGNHKIQIEHSEFGLWKELDDALNLTQAVLHHTPLYIETLRELIIGCLTQAEDGFFPDIRNAVFLALDKEMEPQRLNVFVQFVDGAIVFDSEPKGQ